MWLPRLSHCSSNSHVESDFRRWLYFILAHNSIVITEWYYTKQFPLFLWSYYLNFLLATSKSKIRHSWGWITHRGLFSVNIYLVTAPVLCAIPGGSVASTYTVEQWEWQNEGEMFPLSWKDWGPQWCWWKPWLTLCLREQLDLSLTDRSEPGQVLLGQSTITRQAPSQADNTTGHAWKHSVPRMLMILSQLCW